MDSSGLTSLGGAPLRGWTLKSLGVKKGPWSKVTSGKWERRTMHPAAQLDSSPHQSPGGGRGLAPLLSCSLAPEARFCFPPPGVQGGSGEDRQGGMETYTGEVRLSGLRLA